MRIKRVKSARLQRHLAWAIPLALAPISYFAAAFGLVGISQGMDDGSLPSWWAWIGVALGLAALVCPVIALVHASTGGFRAFRHWRRSQGHFTKNEAAVAQREAVSTGAWARAQKLQSSLAQREIPPAIHVWDVVPNANEVFFLDVPADYARYYGMDVSYTQSSGFYYGRPSFVLAGVGISAIANAARRDNAARQAVAHWRERQPCRVLVSNQRLMCQVGGQWLSFYFNAMNAVYPEIENWSLITQYDSTSPLLLSGPQIPEIALMTVLATQGPDAVVHHPSLQRLRMAQVTKST